MPEADLKAVKFSLMTSSDMVIFHTGCRFNLLSLEITIEFVLFQEKLSSASIIEMCDVTNAKLGLPNGAPQCATCGSQSVRDCDGK